MKFTDLEKIIDSVKKYSSKLFAFDRDKTASLEDIENAERSLNVCFPEDYKLFLRRYGGGYFAYTVVYSCDCSSKFYILNNTSKEWIAENGFLPIIDFETGDLGGFRVECGKCAELFCICTHGNTSTVTETDFDFCTAVSKYALKQ